MKKNMGYADRIFRVLLAAVIAFLYWNEIITGTLATIFLVVGATLATIFLVVGAIFLVTSLIGLCPCYSIFGMSTCKVKEK